MTMRIPPRAGKTIPVIGVPAYWHESEAILGRSASAVPDSYIRALIAIDAAPLIIPVIQNGIVLASLFQQIDGLLLIGGPDLDPVHYHQSAHAGLRRITPERDELELQITQWALDRDLPIMAICRGIQTLNVAAGGSLWQDLASQVPASSKHDYHPDYPLDYLAHSVKPLPGTRLSGALGADEIMVNSLHHQAINELGKGLRPTAHAPDGIIEAVEAINATWVLGVQWHPEWLVNNDERMVRLFTAFRDVCIQHGRTIRSEL